jgi:RNA polymerase sigma-70 factor (ECF subfamily)
MGKTLGDRLLAHLPRQKTRTPELEHALEELVRQASTTHPAAAERIDALLAFVARRLPEGGDLLNALGQLRVEDLTLAWACTEGDTDAIERIERDHFDVIDQALARLPDAAAQAQEIKQQLRKRLFVGEPAPSKQGGVVSGGEEGQPPRITQYAGRGDLRSWLRVAAVRCGLDLLRAQKREVELSDRILDQLSIPEDAELGHLKQRYRHAFKDAFEDALTLLSVRDRNVLRYFYIEELNIDQIGAIFNVHRATVARWLVRIRDALLRDTRRVLMERLRIGPGEFESIMRLIRSQLDASIERLL